MAEYLRIGEVAQAVGVSVDTLRRWEANGTVQFERRGNQRVLRADKLAALTASRQRPATRRRAPATASTAWSWASPATG